MGLSSYIKDKIDKFRYRKLRKITLNQCKTFVPPITYANVVKVYDGDTITIGCLIDKVTYKFSTRLPRIDTPELRTSNDIEKRAGYLVRNKVSNQVLNHIVKVGKLDYDKYGRLLCEIYFKNSNGKYINLSDWILENNYAVPYNGGAKECVDWSYLL